MQNLINCAEAEWLSETATREQILLRIMKLDNEWRVKAGKLEDEVKALREDLANPSF